MITAVIEPVRDFLARSRVIFAGETRPLEWTNGNLTAEFDDPGGDRIQVALATPDPRSRDGAGDNGDGRGLGLAIAG